MTTVYRKEITGPNTWTSQSIGGKEGLVWKLDDKHLDACDQLLKTLEQLKTQDIGRADFEHPALTPFLEDVRSEIMNGKGAVIIRGIDTSRYGRQDCERLFWGFGTHWGNAAVQSTRADRLGYIRNEPDDPMARGYRSTGELVLHTDSRPIIAFLSLQVAESGGYSHLASGLAIHNIILRERPDLLESLYRGYHYLSNEIELTPCCIPVFANVNGVVSCYFFEGHMRKAAKSLGVNLPSDLDEAVTYFAAVAARKNVHVNFLLEPGEIMVANNFVVLHARTMFKNSAQKERLLARLWLNVPNGRPTIPEFLERSRRFDKNYDPLYTEAV